MRLKALSAFIVLGVLPLLALAINHGMEIRQLLSDHADERAESAARAAATLIGYEVEAAREGVVLAPTPRPGGIVGARGSPSSTSPSLSSRGPAVCTRALGWADTSEQARETVSADQPGGVSRPPFQPLPSRRIGRALETSVTTDGTRLFLLDAEAGTAALTGECSAAALDRAWKAVEVRADRAGERGEAHGSSLTAAVSPVPGTSWVVVALTDPVLPAVRTAQADSLFWALLSVVCGAAVICMLMARWLRPIDELQKAVAGIGDGDLEGWIPPPGGDEVGSLTASFKRMSERLSHMVRHVEQSSRLEAVGVMAAHLAHEVRSPLSSIRLNLQGLDRKRASGDIPADQEPAIRLSLREVERLEKTIDSVLQVAGGRTDRLSKAKICSLHGILQDVRDVLQSVLEKRNVRVLFELGAETDRVRVDPGRLKGVFMNLLVNASEAMPGGGTVRIRSSLELDHDGRHVIQVTVRDSGTGIPPEIRDEIFDPFMTTKEEGSGLGLAASLRAVRDEGGDLILVDPAEDGPGACFSVVLPVVPRVDLDRPVVAPSSSEDLDSLRSVAYAPRNEALSRSSRVISVSPVEA